MHSQDERLGASYIYWYQLLVHRTYFQVCSGANDTIEGSH